MMRDCFPRASSANAIASCEPIESPSGRACDVIRKRCRLITAPRIRLISASAVAGRASGTGLLIGLRLAAGLWRRGVGPAVALGGVTSLRVDFVQDAFDSIAALDRLVEEEFEDWDPLQSQPAAELPAEERGGRAQAPRGVAAGLLVGEGG